MRIVVGVENPSWISTNPGVTGIGGSEEAALYMRDAMDALGHEFILTGNMQEPCDVFVSWRLAYLKNPNAKKQYLWCHDIAVHPHWNTDEARHFDRVIMLNEHHAKLYGAAGCPREKMFVCSNGVDLKQFDQQVERIPGKCIYFSHPHRGLHKLREYWPQIRAAVPHATLHAFWWEERFFKDYPSNEALGIMPMRKLGHDELAREILSSDLLTYPSVFSPEINPITCIKAQVGGAWPVVIMAGGMVDTLQFGYFCTEANYVDTVIETLRHPELYAKSRERMMTKSRDRYSWKNIAKAWEEEFEKQIHPTNPNPDDAGLQTIEDGAYPSR